jgi:tRNA threonylcarbamoyladenosine biosynthesis protein TsaB
LYAVPSLALLVGARHREPGAYAAVSDAMRGEWFLGLYHVDGQGQVTETSAAAIAAPAAIERAVRGGATLLGARLLHDGTLHGSGDAEVPRAAGAIRCANLLAAPVSLAAWEPEYGRLAEAQVKWESAHGRALGA